MKLPKTLVTILLAQLSYEPSFAQARNKEANSYAQSPVGGSFSQTQYPFLRIEPNPDYIGSPAKPLGGAGYVWKFSLVEIRQGWGKEYGVGWASMKLLRALQGNFNIFINKALLGKRLELQRGGGGGIGVSFSGQRWERTPGRYKDGQSVNSGKAIALFTTNYQVFIGLNLYLNRMWSIMGRYGYYGYGFSFGRDTWNDEKVDMPNGDNFYLDHEWLEYRVRRSRGWTYELALVLW